MRRIISIALILALSLQYFSHLGMIAYFQVNREYIARALCVNREKPAQTCHGQCFLKKNLDVADDQHSDENPLPSTKLKVEFPFFVVIENVYPIRISLEDQLHNSICFIGILAGYFSTPFHPPASGA